MHPPDIPQGDISAFIDRTERLYAQMDSAYRRAAESSGFVCSGCEDNCCRTLFHHHTFAEYFTLHRGFSGLPRPQREKIRARADAYLRAAAAGGGSPRKRQLCPLNESERCVLYAQRPMICRLHGIPHRFTPPGGRPQTGPGCEAFHLRCGHLDLHRLDRTPHYLRLAQLESCFKQALGVERKIKLTLAEMLLREPLEYIGKTAAFR